MQERCNSIVNTLESQLSWTNPLKCKYIISFLLKNLACIVLPVTCYQYSTKTRTCSYTGIVTSSAKMCSSKINTSSHIYKGWGMSNLWKNIKPLLPSSTIWWHRSGSILAQVMACCRTYHQKCSMAFTWEQFHMKWSWIQSVICVCRLRFWNYYHISQRPVSLQTVVSNSFSLMKNFVFWLKLHWSFLKNQLKITQHWFR